MDESTPPPTHPTDGRVSSTRQRRQHVAPAADNYAPQEPDYQEYGTQLEIPVGKSGPANLEPGQWAHHIMRLPYKVARNARGIKTAAIRLLSAAEPVREPLVRHTMNYTGRRLDERIGDQAANVESALIQIVGEVEEEECRNCLRGEGPWTQCIRFHGNDGIVPACGNCTWNDKRKRCTSDLEPLTPSTPATPRGHRRGQSSQSSITSQEAQTLETLIDSLESSMLNLQVIYGAEHTINRALHHIIRADPTASESARALIPSPTAPVNQVVDKITELLAQVSEMKAILRRNRAER